MLTDIDSLLREYLLKKGYTKAAAELESEAQTRSTQIPPQSKSDIESKSTMATKILTSIAEELLITGTEGTATLYANGYGLYRNWALGSLDLVRPQLLAVCFPLFIYCYLGIVRTSVNNEEAQEFFRKWSSDHMDNNSNELRSSHQPPPLF